MSDRSGNNKKLIAVCDSDLSYAGRLVEYLRQEAAFPFEIRLYTSTETLLEDCDTREADLVVIAQSQYTPAAAQTKDDFFDGKNVGKKVIQDVPCS